MAQDVVWIIDTSSIIEVRRAIENSKKADVFERMGVLVEEGRLIFPKQVLEEMERVADRLNPDAQYKWAKKHEGKATEHAPTFEEVREILAVVPTVLDPD